jgi:hypothetical protein
MTRSDWICNACGEGFETKGKRDGHRQRIHRQKMISGVENQGVKRSENGKFMCRCGRNYTWPRSLQRHQRSCRIETLSKEMKNNEDNGDKGISLFSCRLLYENMLR